MKTIKEVRTEVKYGDVFTTKNFAEAVKKGMFNLYDGIGYYHDGINETDEYVSFNYETLLEDTKKYPYVCWYNK